MIIIMIVANCISILGDEAEWIRYRNTTIYYLRVSSNWILQNFTFRAVSNAVHATVCMPSSNKSGTCPTALECRK